MPKTFEELMGGLEPDAASLVTKHIESLTAASEATINQLQAKITDLEKAAKAVPAPVAPAAPAPNDIFKNASPEIKAAVEKMQNQLQQLLDAQANELVEKRYQLCKAIPVEESALRGVLKSASPAVVDVLQKAATAISEGLMKAKGSSVDGPITSGTGDDAYAILEKSAKAISAELGVTFEKAFSEACSRDPETYRKYVEGVR